MPLLGKAAVVIWCEIDAALRAEHDAWHSGEHLPERMAIPGFLRGRRCVAADTAAPWPYFILYEVEDASVLTSAAYLERLNNPTPWSRKIQAACRLSRTLCRVTSSQGDGVGAHLVTAKLASTAPLLDFGGRPGVVAVHLLERDRSVQRPRTNEESIRRGGADEAVERVLIVEGYDGAALQQALSRQELAADRYVLSHLMVAA